MPGAKTVGKQLGKEGPVGPTDLQADHEPMVHPCGKPGLWFPKLQRAKCVQQVRGGDPAPLLSSGDTSGVLCTPLGFPEQDRYRCIGTAQQKAIRMFKEHLPKQGEAERAGVVRPGEKAQVTEQEATA